EHGRDRLTSGIWERALEHHDKLATGLIDDAVAALGAGIASAVNLLDVEAVVIGGGLGGRFPPPPPRGGGARHGGGLGSPFRRPLPRAYSRGDAAAPVQRRAPAGRS